MAAKLGYDGLEVMVWTDKVSQSPDALRGLATHYRMPVKAVHAPCLLVTQRVWSTDPAVRLRRAAELADAVGAGVVVVHPPFSWQREYARGFFRRVLFEVMQGAHGTLVAVLPRERAGSALFVDGILLPRPLDVVGLLDRHQVAPDDAAASAVRATAQLLRGMMSTDGITVLRADGCIIGYNVFVRHPETLARL